MSIFYEIEFAKYILPYQNIEQIHYTPSVFTRYLFEKVAIIHCIFLIYSEIIVDNYE